MGCVKSTPVRVARPFASGVSWGGGNGGPASASIGDARTSSHGVGDMHALPAGRRAPAGSRHRERQRLPHMGRRAGSGRPLLEPTCRATQHGAPPRAARRRRSPSRQGEKRALARASCGSVGRSREELRNHCATPLCSPRSGGGQSSAGVQPSSTSKNAFFNVEERRGGGGD